MFKLRLLFLVQSDLLQFIIFIYIKKHNKLSWMIYSEYDYKDKILQMSDKFISAIMLILNKKHA